MQENPSIIITAGPSLDDPSVLSDILQKNVSWVRFNLSHGSQEEHFARYTTIKNKAKELGRDVKFFIDLRGPKMRIGEIENGEVELVTGNEIRISPNQILGNASSIFIDVPNLHTYVEEGMSIFLHDGIIEIKVTAKEGETIVCTIVRGGVITSHKGVNIPDASIPLDVITPKDKEDLQFALTSMDIHGAALSFVRTKEDINTLKEILATYQKPLSVISKIETKQALINIKDILDASDIIMYARGDLGIEIPAVKIPITQKELCLTAKEYNKPVIVATQILTSMIEKPIPTRAEMTDAIDGLLDGAKYLMLSDETTIGGHPLEAVEVLHNAITEFVTNQEEYKAFEV